MAKKQRDQQFFATLAAMSVEYAAAVVQRHDTHVKGLETSKRQERMRRSWCMYYSRSRDGDWDDTELTSAGSLGELTLIRPAEYRNLVQHQLNLVTEAPPGYECVAINTASESLAQAILGNGLLDYYLRVFHLDDLRVRRAEIALLLGESFLVVTWDHNAGKEYGVKDVPARDANGKKLLDEAGQPQLVKAPAYEGELSFSVRTPFEVAYDPLSPDLQRPRWTITKEPMNRWDAVELFPEHREKLLGAETWSSVTKAWGVSTEYDHDDYIAVYRVGVEKSAAVRAGRESLVLDAETVLSDGPLSEDRVGVFRLAASDIVFQSGGYTNNFDVLPVAEAFAAQASTVLSNHSAFAGQVIATPIGSGVKPHHLGRGLALLQYQPYSDVDGKPIPPPAAVQFLATPPEVFTFLDWLQKAGERYSGIHGVLRGEANASDSGSKTALLHATSQQFANQFHRNLARSDEDAGMHVLSSIRSHATTKRVATIAGKFDSFTEQTYTGEDLKKISRVTVRRSDVMRDTFMGRKELADTLIKMPPDQRQQYLGMLNTGRVDALAEGAQAQTLLIRRENEQLRDPKKGIPLVAPTDDHHAHIDGHRCEYDDPAIREAADPSVRDRVWSHIQEHMAALTPGHKKFAGPQVLAACKQQPLPPLQPVGVPPPAGAPGGAGATPPAPHPPGAPPPSGPPGPPQRLDNQNAQANGMPRMPKPPVNPLTGRPAAIPVPPAPAITQG